MKRILRGAGCFLLLLFLFQSAGQYLLFSTLQHRARRTAIHRLARQLPDHQLTVLRLAPAEKKHLRHVDATEIRYRGRLYDIVRTAHLRDTLVFHTIPDDRETALYQSWTRQFRQSMPRPGDPVTPLDLFQTFSRQKYLPPSFTSLEKSDRSPTPRPVYRTAFPDTPFRSTPVPPPRG